MAFKQIKGLTVEIGGDTTKLGKALEDVNKKSRDLSSELGEVNKLLKLDPGNTELLAQKQKILAEAVSTTGDKLDKLKQAEKQVQEQFKRGEVSEEQVRALQREIVATTKKMDEYEQASKETEKALKGVADESKDVEQSSGNMGAALANAAKVGLQAVAAAATAAVGALVGAAESTREYRTEMAKLDTAFTTNGHTSEAALSAYRDLQGVLGETEQAVEAANHLAVLTENEKDLATWTGDILPGVFATFGASLPIEGLTEAANETAKVGAVTGPLADALNWAGIAEDEFNEKLAACTNEQERQTLIMETLQGAYGSASEAFKETNAEVIRANQANESWVASMAEAGGAIEPVITDVKQMGAALLSEAVPGIQQLAGSFRDLLSGDMAGADGVGAALSGIITQLLNKVTEMLPAVSQIAVSLVTTLTGTILSMAPQLVTTAGDIVLTLIQGLTQAAPTLISGAVEAFNGILQALTLVIPPLVAELPKLVTAVVGALISAAPQLLDGALEFLLAIVDALPLLIAALVPEIPSIVSTVILGLLDMIPQLLDAAVTLLLSIVEAIPQICVELIRALPQIWQTMSSYFSQLPGKLWEILKSIISNFGRWATESRAKMAEGAKNIFNAVVDTLKSLPQKLLSIGGDLIAGLWNGINDKLSWLKDKISGFASSVLDSIKGFFGVHSPSTETAWIGDMLDRGLAEGMLDNMGKPISAMRKVTGGVLDAAQTVDGLSVERSLQHSSAASALAGAFPAGIGEKLDKILTAIERGQVLTIDGKQLVGGTAAMYDNTLGQRRALAARGAI